MTAATTQATELSRKLELVVQVGLLLTGTSDLEAIVQAATDAGLQLSGAQFGAFFYNVNNAGGGELSALYALRGAAGKVRGLPHAAQHSDFWANL